MCRSLTPRQRDLLQQYADDVEGRSPTKERMSQTTAPEDTSNSRQSTASDDKNGTISFSSSDPSPRGGGWLSQMRSKVRELTGI